MSERGDFIKWFSELNKSSGPVAGGKGANLSEIYNLKIKVPPGFVVTAQAYNYFLNEAGLVPKIKSLLSKINYEDTEQLDQVTHEIREIIENAKVPKEMAEEIIEAYETLEAGSKNSEGTEAESILEKNTGSTFVAVRSSATTEDLAEASFAGQQDTFLNVRGNESLLLHVKKCFSSLFTPRATYYRNKKGFKHEQASLAVVVQKMIDSDKSGVIFSKDPSTNKDVIIIEAVWGLGEGIVSGQITPDKYIVSQKDGNFKINSKEIAAKKIAIIKKEDGGQKVVKLKEEFSKQQVLKEYEILNLAETAIKLEKHYKKPQDIEFAIEGEKIYIVQTRPITTLEKKTQGAGKEITGEVILKGQGASPGIGVGKVKIINDLADLKKIETGDILVTKMTNPDMVVTMQKSAAIITDEGGLTAHAAIVSREMGIPAVVGTQEATEKLKDGDIVTVDGFTGKIYKGKVAEGVQKEIKPVTAKTKTAVKVIVDLPSFANRAAKTGIKSIGLARLEGIIAESGKHPNYFIKKDKIKDYEEIIFRGLNEMAEFFEEIWVRTSDIRSDEFSNLEGAPEKVEANPMLGMHGIRFSLKHPEIMKAELNAMKRVSANGSKIGVMAPQIISVEEVKELKKLIKEVGFTKAKVGIMVETPAAVALIRELCEEKIEFASFGTNDLTQYTLAVDRGNEEVQEIYNEMHPAMLKQLASVIEVCREFNVESSVCGQSGSKKEMVKFLVEKGISSISVNADVASDIADYIAEVESTLDKPETGGDTSEKEEIISVKEEKSETSKPNVEVIRENTEGLDERVADEIKRNEEKIEEELPTIRGSEYIQGPKRDDNDGEDEVVYVF